MGPRYTSYPTADRFVEAFDSTLYGTWLGSVGATVARRPLSLYVHLPFCSTICYCRACNKVITQDRARTGGYLDALQVEAELVAARLGGASEVGQLHFRGGSPTFLDEEELHRTIGMLAERFPLEAARKGQGETSIEVDARTCPPEKVRVLAELGFNRMSVGVQDFEPAVQEASNRLQEFDA